MLRHLWLAGVLVVAACANPEPEEATLPESEPPLEACVSAVADAAEGSEEPDLWPAFDDCSSLEDFVVAVEETDASLLGDVDPETYVQTRCAEAEEIDRPDLCDSI